MQNFNSDKTQTLDKVLESQKKLGKIKAEEKIIEKNYKKELLKIQDCENYQESAHEIEEYINCFEIYKEKIAKSDLQQKLALIKFLEEHIKLKEMDYLICNSYKSLIQKTDLVKLEIEKIQYDLSYLQIFTDQNNLIKNINEYTQRKNDLENSLQRLINARNYQEKAYEAYQKCLILKVKLNLKLQKLDNDIIILACEYFPADIHLKAKEALSSLDKKFHVIENLDTLVLIRHNNIINFIKFSVELKIEAYVKFVQKNLINIDINKSLQYLAEARRRHSYFQEMQQENQKTSTTPAFKLNFNLNN